MRQGASLRLLYVRSCDQSYRRRRYAGDGCTLRRLSDDAVLQLRTHRALNGAGSVSVACRVAFEMVRLTLFATEPS